MIEIKSERDWLDYLQTHLNKPESAIKEVRFINWPTLEIVIDGEKYNGTLPTELMRGIVEFQDEFYRAYAKLRYKTKSHRLTPEDRERLEFVFKIENNCTKGTANEGDLLNVIVENIDKIFANMSGEEKLIGLAILVFAYTGYRIFEKFSDSQVKAKEIEAETEALKQQKQAVVEAIQASGKVPKVANEFKSDTEQAFKSIFNGAKGASAIKISDGQWDRDEIDTIIQTPERNREKKERSMPLYIEGIRRNRGYLTLNVTDEDDRSFSMRVESIMADADETMQLFDAFKNNRKINITFTAKLVDGEITAGSFIELSKTK